MKALLIVVLISITTLCSAQLTTGTVTGFNYDPKFTISDRPASTCVAIALHFNPAIPNDTTLLPFKEYFLKYFLGSERDYDAWTSLYKFDASGGKCHYIEVRIRYGQIAEDCTFDEFKKLIWN